MSKITNLKFPEGKFTHAELAKANEKAPQAIWKQLQDLLKSGVLVQDGISAGKGKPSKLFEVATGTPIPVVTPTDKALNKVTAEVKTTPAEEAEIIATLSDKKQASVQTKVISDIVVEPIKATVRPVHRELKQLCPVCEKPLFALDDATGVMVWCGRGADECPSVESPFGHGKSENAAYEILIQRFHPLPKKK